MSTLRDLTSQAHAEAEKTPFMRLVFAKAITPEDYLNYVANICLIYTALEPIAKKMGIFDDLPGIERIPNIRKDIAHLDAEVGKPAKLAHDTVGYYNHICSLTSVKQINAHVYVRYAGDLYGGQVLKTMVPGYGHWYDFGENLPTLRNNMRSKFTPENTDLSEVFDAYRSTTQILNELTMPDFNAFRTEEQKAENRKYRYL